MGANMPLVTILSLAILARCLHISGISTWRMWHQCLGTLYPQPHLRAHTIAAGVECTDFPTRRHPDDKIGTPKGLHHWLPHWRNGPCIPRGGLAQYLLRM